MISSIAEMSFFMGKVNEASTMRDGTAEQAAENRLTRSLSPGSVNCSPVKYWKYGS
jgi:hypothetical protein